MVRLIMGANGAGKTKQLIELIHAAVESENGSVVCIEPSADMTYDISYNVRLVNAGDKDLQAVEDFLGWLDRFSNTNDVKFTVTISADEDSATEGLRQYT